MFVWFVWFVDKLMGLDAVRSSRLGTTNHTNHTNGRVNSAVAGRRGGAAKPPPGWAGRGSGARRRR